MAKTVKTKRKERRFGFNQASHACQKKENIEQKGERWEWISTLEKILHICYKLLFSMNSRTIFVVVEKLNMKI